MLQVLDHILFWAHILIISFNLFGWLVPVFRKWHLLVAGVTLLSWLVLGIWFGFGYCFLTDWHWQVKQALGESSLPSSFVKYFIDGYTNIDMNARSVDVLTVAGFSVAILFSIYVNYFRKS